MPSGEQSQPWKVKESSSISQDWVLMREKKCCGGGGGAADVAWLRFGTGLQESFIVHLCLLASPSGGCFQSRFNGRVSCQLPVCCPVNG